MHQKAIKMVLRRFFVAIQLPQPVSPLLEMALRRFFVAVSVCQVESPLRECTLVIDTTENRHLHSPKVKEILQDQVRFGGAVSPLPFQVQASQHQLVLAMISSGAV